MGKQPRQPIERATLSVNDAAFWDWMAEEMEIDLHDLTLFGAEQRGDIVLFDVGVKFPTFEQKDEDVSRC